MITDEMVEALQATITEMCGRHMTPCAEVSRRALTAAFSTIERVDDDALVERVAAELFDRIVIGGEGYEGTADHLKDNWREYARAALRTATPVLMARGAAQMRERAAKACDFHVREPFGEDGHVLREPRMEEIAAAIRALPIGGK